MVKQNIIFLKKKEDPLSHGPPHVKIYTYITKTNNTQDGRSMPMVQNTGKLAKHNYYILHKI